MCSLWLQIPNKINIVLFPFFYQEAIAGFHSYLVPSFLTHYFNSRLFKACFIKALTGIHLTWSCSLHFSLGLTESYRLQDYFEPPCCFIFPWSLCSLQEDSIMERWGKKPGTPQLPVHVGHILPACSQYLWFHHALNKIRRKEEWAQRMHRSLHYCRSLPAAHSC